MNCRIKLLSTIIALLFVAVANSQSPVVLHHNGVSTMFYKSTGFSDAYSAAAIGDTIYLPGGFFDGFTINKKIVIIGAGHHPDSTSPTHATQINGSMTLGPDADSSHLEGLHITGHLNVSATGNKIDRLIIRRNVIDGNIVLDGDRTNPSLHIEIAGNVVRGSVDVSNSTNAVLTNNIFQSRVHYVFQGSIANNVFTANPYLGYPFYFYNNIYDCDNSTIENNVFVHPDGTLGFAYCDNSVISKNLFASTAAIDYTNNFPSGNYTAVGSANVLVNWTSSSYNYTDNYHLKNPTTYLGSDATQVGIYGGMKPWKEGAIPFNPHIQAKTIATNTDADGKIQVQVQVAAQNN